MVNGALIHHNFQIIISDGFTVDNQFGAALQMGAKIVKDYPIQLG